METCMKRILSALMLAALAALACLQMSGCAERAYVLGADGEKIAVTAEADAVSGATTWTTADGAAVDAGSVETQRELSPAAEATVEAALSVGQAQGGVLGAVSSGLLLLWGVYKSRKVNATKLTLESVVSGVSDVLQAARIAVAQGQKLTEEDIKGLLKAAQNDAGTREAVRALLEEQSADDKTGAVASALRSLKKWVL